MSPMRHRRGAFLLGGALFAGFLVAGGCASVIGLDGLAYDREDGGGGAGSTSAGSASPLASSGATTTSSASGSDAGSSSAGGDPGSSSAGGGDPTSSGSGGSTGFPVTGTRDGYLDLMKYYDGAFWRFEESDGAGVAVDDGFYNFGTKGAAPSDWDGNYQASGGAVTLEIGGVFADSRAASFSSGGRVVIPRQDPIPYAFEYLSDEGAFTLSVFVKVQGVPEPPVTIAACYDADLDRGWTVRLGDDLVLERHGLDEGGNAVVETNSMAVTNEPGWHLLTIEKLSGLGGQLRGYVDGVKALSETPPLVRTMEPHDGVLMMGAETLSDGAAPSVTLDELFLVPYGLGQNQLDAQIACLQGGACTPPVE